MPKPSDNSQLDRRSLTALLRKNAALFWWVPSDKIEALSLESLVEAVLNYGTVESVQDLFEAFGIERIASIFRRQIRAERKKYLPQTENYFTLYFNKYAP